VEKWKFSLENAGEAKTMEGAKGVDVDDMNNITTISIQITFAFLC
jgi:hypothetical protein